MADAGPEIAMPAVFVIRADGVIAWRVIGESMRDLPLVESILTAVAAARTPAEPPATEPPATEPPAEVTN